MKILAVLILAGAAMAQQTPAAIDPSNPVVCDGGCMNAETQKPPVYNEVPGDTHTAKACRKFHGIPVFSGGAYSGCTWPENSQTGKLEVPRNCRRTQESDGSTSLECDCSACGHAADDPAPSPAQPAAPSSDSPNGPDMSGDPNRRTL